MRGTLWRAPTSRSGLAPVEHGHGVGAVGLAQRGAHGIGDVARVGLLHEVGEHLRVGLRAEAMAPREQAVPQVPEVLDDAVVDDRDIAGAVDVGMGVEVVGPAVGRPAGVGEADRRLGRGVEQRGAQVGQLARALLHEQLARCRDEGDAGRVIAAVLEAREALEQDGRRVARPDVSDDAAHAAQGSRQLDWFRRSAASADRESASASTRAGSSPSTMIRNAGSVPDGRTRIRPRPASSASAARTASTSCRSASHWSLWRTVMARCCWG